ncbi:MAG: ADP-ribosylglycohydrolase family protein [Chloroflexi bacterium]|nr:ADP-ribosylglycohydrolase family protein [Chloroflexota bacterium]
MTNGIRVPAVEQFTGALLGLAIGDALGRPTEGKRQDEIRTRPRNELLTFRGYRDGRLGRGLPPGSWSDDTQQALLLADTLVAHRGFDGHDYADRMYALWRSGEARGYGRVYQKAMERRDAGQPWDGVAVDDDTMNGAAMRIAPLGLFYWFDAAALTDAAVRSSHITHRHPAAVAGAAGVAHALAYALTHEHVEPDAFVAYLSRQLAPLDRQTAEHVHILMRVAGLDIDDAFAALSEVPEFASPPAAGRGPGVGGMTISLLLISGYLFLHTQGDYMRAVEGAILLGGDTDGTAATAGALCAAQRGTGGVPQALADTVEETERIRVLSILLHERSLEASGR